MRSMHLDASGDGDHVLARTAGAEDGDRRRHDDGRGVAAGQHAEVRQHEGEIAQFIGRQRALAARRA